MTNDLIEVQRRSLPDSAKLIVSCLRITGNFYSSRDLYIEVTQKLKDAAKHAIVVCEENLKPTDRESLKGAIYTLLVHYYTKDLPQSVQTQVAKDWMRALCEFPSWAIERARQEWINTSSKKPTPSDIRKLCLEMVSKDRAIIAQSNLILKSPLEEDVKPATEEQKAEVEEIVAKIKKNLKSPEAEGSL